MITVHSQSRSHAGVLLSAYDDKEAVVEHIQRQLAQPGPINIVIQRKPNQRKKV